MKTRHRLYQLRMISPKPVSFEDLAVPDVLPGVDLVNTETVITIKSDLRGIRCNLEGGNAAHKLSNHSLASVNQGFDAVVLF